MRPLAVLQVQDHIEMDCVILWDDGRRYVAFAYQDGRVQRTLPLKGDSLSADIEEAQFGFQIRPHQLTGVSSLANAQDYGAPVLTPEVPVPVVHVQPSPGGAPGRWN